MKKCLFFKYVFRTQKTWFLSYIGKERKTKDNVKPEPRFTGIFGGKIILYNLFKDDIVLEPSEIESVTLSHDDISYNEDTKRQELCLPYDDPYLYFIAAQEGTYKWATRCYVVEMKDGSAYSVCLPYKYLEKDHLYSSPDCPGSDYIFDSIGWVKLSKKISKYSLEYCEKVMKCLGQ